jgi:hypothetical protein
MSIVSKAMLSIALGCFGSITDAAEPITLSGKLEVLSCIQSCGACCGSHVITDTSGKLSLQVGNSFIDLAKFADDGTTHQFSGRYYETAGQCGIGQCTLFAVESVDAALSPAAIYNPATGKLSIQSVVIEGDESTPYRVTLSEPFVIDSAVAHRDQETIPQGGDCSVATAVCASGTTCVSYFGIAGPNGPEFKTCETPCSSPTSSCPTGQSCVTIADGPGPVCRAD